MLGIALGMALTLFGLYAFLRQGETNGSGLALLGFLFLTIGMTGGILTQGLNYAIVALASAPVLACLVIRIVAPASVRIEGLILAVDAVYVVWMPCLMVKGGPAGKGRG